MESHAEPFSTQNHSVAHISSTAERRDVKRKKKNERREKEGDEENSAKRTCNETVIKSYNDKAIFWTANNKVVIEHYNPSEGSRDE